MTTTEMKTRIATLVNIIVNNTRHTKNDDILEDISHELCHVARKGEFDHIKGYDNAINASDPYTITYVVSMAGEDTTHHRGSTHRKIATFILSWLRS
jgi:hypothetical protein